MKNKKQIIKKYFKKNFVQISKFLSNSFFVRKSDNSFFNKVSKLEKYQNIIEKFSQFNKSCWKSRFWIN